MAEAEAPSTDGVAKRKHARRSATVPLAKVHMDEEEHHLNLQMNGLPQLGEGASGQAFFARNELDGRMYCVKSVLLKTEDMQTAVVNEARIHAEFNHESVVKYCYSWVDQQEGQTAFCMLMELCQSDLWHCLEFSTPTQEERMRWSRQLAAALSHIHAHSIVHRDLNPWNVLVSNSRDVKVGDFGLSVHCPPGGFLSGKEATGAVPLDESALCSLYSAPELGAEAYNSAADVFSLGVTLFAIWDMDNSSSPEEEEGGKDGGVEEEVANTGEAGNADAGDAGGDEAGGGEAAGGDTATGDAGEAGDAGDAGNASADAEASGDADDDGRLYACNECGDSASLGAIDPDDGQWYCKPCWEAFVKGDLEDAAEGTDENCELSKVDSLVSRIEKLHETQQLPDDFASKCPIASLVLSMISHEPSERPSAKDVHSAILSASAASEQA